MTRETTDLSGGCTCGSIRYRLRCAPMFVHCCHCTWCQRETGSAFAINALIEADHLEILSGQPETIDTPTNSGQVQKISRCPSCQVAVWSAYAYAGIGELVRFVRAGTLDDPAAAPPDIHIFTSTKQSWVRLPDDVPAVEAYYSAKDMWPQASLDRRANLFAVKAAERRRSSDRIGGSKA